MGEVKAEFRLVVVDSVGDEIHGVQLEGRFAQEIEVGNTKLVAIRGGNFGAVEWRHFVRSFYKNMGDDGGKVLLMCLEDGAELAVLERTEPTGDYIDVLFDGPPSHESGRFVEVEDAERRSVNVGEWIERGDGLWALRLPRPPSEPRSGA
jgi:hypothetical protein